MILLFLLACADDVDLEPGQSVEPAFAPTWGAWTARIASTWGGDCALEDDGTYWPEEQTWLLEEDRYGFAIRDEIGYRIPCVLDDMDFSCPLELTQDDLSSYGYDVFATYTSAWSGTFQDAGHLSGLYTVAAECEGEDCDQLTGFGEDFRFPCTAEADLEAELDG